MQLRPLRPPPAIVGAKALLAGLLVCGALFPHLGGFEGKGMAFRLPIFLAPALVAPAIWWRRRGAYPVALDVALTVPFLLDTAANAVGLYDHFDPTDDVLHFVNWFVLVGGIAVTLWLSTERSMPPRWLVWTAASGIGAAAIIVWEAGEYAVMRAGVGGLSLTYGDTIGDLLLSSGGGAIGAWIAIAVVDRNAPATRASVSERRS